MLSAPFFLWLLFLSVPLVYLHMKKKHRTEVTVSSHLFWSEFTGKSDTEFRSLIRRNMHLILQMIILILLVLALSEPVIIKSSIPSGGTVIIIDSSAGMKTTENGTSRFTRAKEEAVRIINERGGASVSVVILSSVPYRLTAMGDSSDVQLRQLDKLSCTETEGDPEAAYRLAESILSGNRDSEIILISDGAFSMGKGFSPTGPVFSFVSAGEKAGNLGIIKANSRRDPSVPERRHVFLSIFNSGSETADSEVEFSLEGEPLGRVAVSVPPGGNADIVKTVDRRAGIIKARLTSKDSFPVDDSVFIPVRPENPVSVLLVTDDDFYLESLLALVDGIELTVSSHIPLNMTADVVIINKPVQAVPGPGRYIFLGHIPENFGIEINGTAELPGIKKWDPEHPLLRSVVPGSFSVYSAAATRPGPGFVPVLEGDVPLIYEFTGENIRAVYLTFPLAASDIYLKPVFPVLLMNILEWLVPEMESEIKASEKAGELITAVNSSGARGKEYDKGTLVLPDGSTEEIEADGVLIKFVPEQTGIYGLSAFGRDLVFPVNLVSGTESDIRPRFSAEDINPGKTESGKGEFPVWRYLLVLGLLVSAAEFLLAFEKREGAGRLGRLQYATAGGAILMLLIGAAGIYLPGSDNTVSTAFLLDISGSISKQSGKAALTWIDNSLSEVPAGAVTGFTVFGEEASVLQGPGPGKFDTASFDLPVSEETNIGAGIDQAAALLPGNGDRRIVLLSDGNETSGDLFHAVERAAASGIKIFTLGLSGQTGSNEVIAGNITGPSRADPEEKITLTLEIESLLKTNGKVYFYLDGKYYGEDSPVFKKGRTLLSYSIRVKESGYHLFEAAVEAEDDTLPRNNLFRKMIYIKGDPPVLYVHDGRGPSEALSVPLEEHGYKFKYISVSEFPDSLNELFSYDSVVLDNIPAYYFSKRKMELLRSAVAGGLGLFVIGGDSSLGAGGYYGTSLEKALPVDVDITSSLDLPGTAIVMVIDNSGSMQDSVGENERKTDLAKQAVFSAVQVLEPSDTAGILAFDSDYRWVVRLESEFNPELVNENLFPLSPGGGTVLLPALREAFRVIDATPASVKHILILSDGYTEGDGFEELTRNIKSRGITVSTVAVGSGANRELMENIAKWGRGRSYFTSDIHNVPSIFVSESLKASKQLFVEEEFFPYSDLPHEILSGIDTESIPPLYGFMLSYPKIGSQVILKGIGGNPLLAVCQYGIGRSAVFTSSLSGIWARDWLDWDSRNLMFGQLLRWISRGEPGTGLRLSLSQSRSDINVEVDAADPEGGFMNSLKLKARAVAPDLEEIDVPVVQQAPGYYTGSFPVDGEGSYFVTVGQASADDGREGELKASFISVPYPEEFRRILPSGSVLKSITDVTGGSMLDISKPLDSDFYIPDASYDSGKFNFWKMFALAGLSLFLLSVIFRLTRVAAYLSTVFRHLFGMLNKSREDAVSYESFRNRLNEIREENERSSRGYSYWFGSESEKQIQSDVYMPGIKKNKG